MIYDRADTLEQWIAGGEAGLRRGFLTHAWALLRWDLRQIQRNARTADVTVGEPAEIDGALDHLEQRRKRKFRPFCDRAPQGIMTDDEGIWLGADQEADAHLQVAGVKE